MEIKAEVLDTIYKKFEEVPISPYLKERHNELFTIFYETAKVLKPIEILPPFQYNFSKEDVLFLEEEFLRSINPNYSKHFIKDYAKGNLCQYAFPYDNSYCYIKKPSINKYAIYYPNTQTIQDLTILSHEYTHHLTGKFPTLQKETSAYTTYCEMLSILAELKCLDFLSENSIAKEDLNIYKHHINKRHYNNISAFLTIQPLLEVYLAKEDLTEKKIDELLNRNPFYNNAGKENIVYNLQVLTKVPYQKCLYYQYPLGMIIAASLHQEKYSNEKFTDLIEIMNTIEVEEFEKRLPQKSAIEYARDMANEFNYQKTKK